MQSTHTDNQPAEAADMQFAEEAVLGNEDVAVQPTNEVPPPETIPTPLAQEEQQPEPKDSQEQAPQRTESQRAKALRVEKVMNDVEDLRQPVGELSRATSLLCGKETSSHPDGVGIQTLQDELDSVQQAHKKARNFGEDLLERMLALDNLSNLASEDRSTRKLAIESIESLLEQVDTAKSRLQNMRRDLEQQIEKEKASHENPAPHKQQDVPEPARPDSAMQQNDPSRMAQAYEQLLECLPPLPPAEAWRRLRLPVQFHAAEEQARYVLQASIPGLDAHSVTANLDEKSDALTIKGLRAPDADEAHLLQERLRAMLEQVARRNPSQLRQVVQSLSPETYLKLGQGRYGSFSQTMTVPADVKVDGIALNYDDGKLLVRLPKKRSMPYSARNVPVHRRLPGHRYHPDPYSSYGMPGLFGSFGSAF